MVKREPDLRRPAFRREVERELTGQETEPWEVIYFKLYKTRFLSLSSTRDGSLMLGSDKARGYCLEMICADFLAGANLNDGDPDVLLHALSRSFHFLPASQRQAFLQSISQQVQ